MSEIDWNANNRSLTLEGRLDSLYRRQKLRDLHDVKTNTMGGVHVIG